MSGRGGDRRPAFNISCNPLLTTLPLLLPLTHLRVKPVPWKFEGSVTQGLEEQPSDPIIDRLRQDLPVRLTGWGLQRDPKVR